MKISKESYMKYFEYQEKKRALQLEKKYTLHGGGPVAPGAPREGYDKVIQGIEQLVNEAKLEKPQNPDKIKALQDHLEKTKIARDSYVQTVDDEIAQVGSPLTGDSEWAKHNAEMRKTAQAIDPDIEAKSKEIAGKAWDSTKDAMHNELDNRQNLNPSFYRDIAAAFTGRAPGNTMTDAAATAKAQAKNQQNESSNRQMEAQASQQIADRNEYTEAGKVASMKNDAQNRQNIANKEGIAGSAAALMRQTNAADVTAERSRQDQQRNIANNRRQEADVAQQGATQSQGLGMQYDHKADEYDQDYDNNIALNDAQNKWYDAQTNYYHSLANFNNANANQHIEAETDNTGTEKTSETETDNTGTETDNTGTEPVTTPEDANNPRPENEVPGTESEPEPETNPNANNDELKQKVIDICTSIAQKTNNYDERRQMLESNDFWESYDFDNGMGSDLAPWKKWALALLNTDGPNLDESQLNKPPTSDYRAKNIELCKAYERELSDCRMKWIRNAFDKYGKPSQEDYAWLTQRAGDYDFGSDDTEDDTVLKGYADFIRNYVYNYKPEAQEISPDNDPNVTHIGPMAQDIEKVNPACIHKDENGIESVDTGRVAMMNAGAIGDIARSLEDIKVRLTRL